MLTGLEAIARGCAEEGVLLVAGHGLRPMGALLEAARREGLRAEGAPGEKVALELALGVSLAGGRALAAVGDLAGAADALHGAAHVGAAGGLVVLALDDPGLELRAVGADSRALARALDLPWVEPSDAPECKEHLAAALALSERWEVPVVLRLTTRVALGARAVSIGPCSAGRASGLRRDAARRVLVAEHGRQLRSRVKERLAQLAAEGVESPLNRVELRSRELGVVTSGAPYLHVREALPDASVLKLGLAFPLPTGLVREFAARVERLVVVEELEPVLESELRALGVPCRGKDLLPQGGELGPDLLAAALGGRARTRREAEPARPAEACPGCPQRGLLHALKRLHVNVHADPGCAAAGAAPPQAAIACAVARGASIAVAQGALSALGERVRGRQVALLAEDALLGSCAALAQAAERGGTVVVAEACPAAQAAASGRDLAALARALGAGRVREVEALDLARTEAALREELARPGLSVVLARGRCPAGRERGPEAFSIRAERCNRCGACLRLGCPAIADALDAMVIDPSSCAACGLCAQVCRAGAVERGPARPAWRAGARPAPPTFFPGAPPAARVGEAASRARLVTGVVVAGVAGQPVVETARLLAEAALSAGLDASCAELPSPLACGGAVWAHVRLGEGVRSPLVGEGEADVLIGLEQLEALRARRLLAPDAFAAVSGRLVPTWRIRAGLEPAPDVVARLAAVTPRVAAVPVESLVQPPGGDAHAGLVLLGLVSPLLPLPADAFRSALRASPAADLDARCQAFERGRELFAAHAGRLAPATLDLLDSAPPRR